MTEHNFERLSWDWGHFTDHNSQQWHDILQLRAAVFVVEQECPYLDPDHKDPTCWHLSVRYQSQLVGTLRAVPPGVSYADCSIGRVSLDPEWRGRQLGREMMQRAIVFTREKWQSPIRISAQAYLQAFYESLGFVTVRGPYQEDDIPHFEMVLS